MGGVGGGGGGEIPTQRIKTINWRPKGNSGWNVVHIAAANGDLPSIRAYIQYSKMESEDDRLSLASKRECKLDILTKQGDTAFHIALRKGHGQAARELAKGGCNVTLPGARGEYAIHIASSRGLIDELQWLITEYKMDVINTVSGVTGQYCQHFAAEEDRCDMLRYLHSLGAKFDAVDFNGNTCYHYACQNGSVGAILWLAELDFSLIKQLNRANRDGESLAREFGWNEAADRIVFLHRAKKRERKTSLEFHSLLARGASLEAVQQWLEKVSGPSLEALVDNWNLKTGTNALLEACHGGNVPVVRFLVKQVSGERKLANCKTGVTALHIAVLNKNVSLAHFLLSELEMDPSRSDASGTTPLLAAEGHAELSKLLNDFADSRRRAQLRTQSPAPQQLQLQQVLPPVIDGASAVVASASSTASVHDDVRVILERVGLGSAQWLARFAEDGFVTLQNLQHLLESDLMEMNMAKGFRRTLLNEVEQLRHQAKQRNMHKLHAHNVDQFLAKHPILPDEMQIELVCSPTQSHFLTKQGGSVSCTCGSAGAPQSCEHALLFRSTLRPSLNTSSNNSSSTTSVVSSLSKTSSSSELPLHFIIQSGELAMERVIGEGSYGIVRLANWRGMKVAVKELKGVHQETELRREASTMARVSNHDHVVPLVGMVLQPVPSVVMAFMCGGSVEDLLFASNSNALPFDLPFYAVLKLIKEAACGVMHLHFQQVIHRDLSARNLLVDANGTVRVADFGFARIKEEHLSKGYTQSHVGPIKWMAPEAIRERKFSEKSDVFSFGVTMYEIVARDRPWANKDSMDVVVRVCGGERMNIRSLAPSDPSIQQLMNRTWAQSPEQRPTMKEVLELVELAWKRAGGDVAADPTGGIASFIAKQQESGGGGGSAGGSDVLANSFTLDSDGYNVHFPL